MMVMMLSVIFHFAAKINPQTQTIKILFFPFPPAAASGPPALFSVLPKFSLPFPQLFLQLLNVFLGMPVLKKIIN